jgi:hypothetical protein
MIANRGAGSSQPVSKQEGRWRFTGFADVGEMQLPEMQRVAKLAMPQQAN